MCRIGGMSPTVDTQELVTPSQAAERLGVTRQWIDSLLRRGKIETVEIAGKRFLRWGDAKGYQPESGGRPAKSAGNGSSSKKRGKK